MKTMEATFGAYPQVNAQEGFGFHKLFMTALAAGLMGVLSSSALFPPSSPPFFRLPAAAAIVALMFLLSGLRIGKFSTGRLLALACWTGFALTSVISALLHRDSLLPEVWQAIGVPLILFTLFPRSVSRFGDKIVLFAIILAFAPYIIVSIIKVPFFTPYNGVFLNANMFGMIVSTMSAAILALLRGSLDQREFSLANLLWQAMLLGILAGSLVLIFLSGSRTSLVTFSIMCLIFFASLFVNMSRNRYMIAMSIAGIFGILLYILGSVAMNASATGFVEYLTNKFLTKIAQDDTTGGRVYIWRLVLTHAQLMGLGSNILGEQPAHNTYMMILATKGPIAMAFMMAVHLTTLMMALRRVSFAIKYDGYSIGPLLIVVNYLVMGLTENVFGTLGNGINISFLLMAGILINQGQYLRLGHPRQGMQ